MSDDLDRVLRSTGPVEELVQSLRNYAYEQIGYLQINEKCLDAADLIEAQAAEITRLRAALATARRDALAEIKQDTDELIEQGRQDGLGYAALRLEELHKNHKYNPQNGEGSEHDVGYYRAISEGVAHIRAAAAKEEK